jgi:hypothetical protein
MKINFLTSSVWRRQANSTELYMIGAFVTANQGVWSCLNIRFSTEEGQESFE